MDFNKLSVSLRYEEEADEQTVFFGFSINKISYKMYVYHHSYLKNRYHIPLTNHCDDQCVFCGNVEKGSFCDAVFKQKVAIFKVFIKQSKNRLKWITREMM